MAFLDEDRERRKRERFNPANFDPLGAQPTPGTVQLISPQVQQAPVQPAPAPAALPAPVQPAPAPVAPPAPAPQPILAPAPAPVAPGAVQSGLAPQAAQPGTMTQAPAPGGGVSGSPATDQGVEAARAFQEQAQIGREQATNARFGAAGRPLPYPQSGLAGGESKSLDERLTTAPSDVVAAAEGDKIVQRFRKLDQTRQRHLERGGSFSPKWRENFRKSEKAAQTRLDIHLAEKAAKSEQDAATARRTVEKHGFAVEGNQRGKNKEATAEADKKRIQTRAKAYGAALNAEKDGRLDDADVLIEAGLQSANTPEEAEKFAVIGRRIQAAKTKATDAAGKKAEHDADRQRQETERKLKTATTANKNAAIRLKPQIDAKKAELDAANDALDLTHEDIASIRKDKDYNPGAAKPDRIEQQLLDRERILVAQEPGQRAERDRLRKEYTEMSQQEADVATGVAPVNNAQPLPTVTTDADFDALPSGAEFIGPNGEKRRKK